MHLEPYDYQTSGSLQDYEFYSEGSRGAIKKVIRFTSIIVGNYSYYNLGFGDCNEEEKRIDDFIVKPFERGNNYKAFVVKSKKSTFRQLKIERIMLSNSKKNRKKVTKVEVNHKMKDYGNEPFFIQKAEASKKIIEKYGIPKSLTTDRK